MFEKTFTFLTLKSMCPLLTCSIIELRRKKENADDRGSEKHKAIYCKC